MEGDAGVQMLMKQMLVYLQIIIQYHKQYMLDQVIHLKLEYMDKHTMVKIYGCFYKNIN